MNQETSEKLAKLLGADDYDSLNNFFNDDKYKQSRRYWLIGTCFSLTLFVLTASNCGGPDVGNPNDGPASTLSE
jgi:hypothetical protein